MNKMRQRSAEIGSIQEASLKTPACIDRFLILIKAPDGEIFLSDMASFRLCLKNAFDIYPKADYLEIKEIKLNELAIGAKAGIPEKVPTFSPGE